MSESSTPEAPSLLFVGGPFDKQAYPLSSDEDTLLGSGPDCAVSLSLENVAPEHVRLKLRDDALVIEDLGSATGTYVNGERLSGERALEDGDRVCLGPPGSSQSAKALVRVPAAATPPAASQPAAPLASEPAAQTPPRPPTPAPFAPAPDVLQFGGESDASEEVALVPVPEPDFLPPLPVPPPRPVASPAPPPPAPAVVPPRAPVAVPPVAPAPQSSAPSALSFEGAEAPEEPEEVVLVTDLGPPSPAPPASPPPAASAAAPTTGTYKAARPDFQTAPPSIVPNADRTSTPSPPLALAPAPAPAKAVARPVAKKAVARRRGLGLSIPAVPRIVLVAAGALILALSAFVFLVGRLRPAPALHSAPPKAESGQVIKLTGESFEPDLAKNSVRFGDQAGRLVNATEKELTVTVPQLPASIVSVSVESRGKRSNALVLKISPVPHVRALKPEVALPGAEILLEGGSLAGDNLSVTIGGIVADVLEPGPEALRVRVPQMAMTEGQTVPIIVKVGEESSRPTQLVLGRLPLLLKIEPARGRPGARVVLKGRGFAPEVSANLVTFGTLPALVVKVQPQELTVLAPGLPPSYAAAPVVVRVGDSVSREVGFGVEAPSLAAYVPRFFPSVAATAPEHAGHEHVFVSTEIGPVLLLSEKDTAASLVERAEAIAQRLNELVDNALRGQPVGFEFREAGAAVGLAGSPTILVSATAKDAAAFNEAWDPEGGRSSGATPRSVARLWTAVLQDYFSLFVSRRRPVALAEVSARGKVLLDIYAEGLRRAGPSGGVPSALVYPPSSTLAKSLRDMALLLPSASSAPRATAMIEGAWTGKMRDGDLTRTIQIRLVAEGSRLTGTASLMKGSLSARAALSEVTYERGVLTFVLDVGRERRHFRGDVNGDQLTGTIRAEPGARDAVGDFTLRFSN